MAIAGRLAILAIMATSSLLVAGGTTQAQTQLVAPTNGLSANDLSMMLQNLDGLTRAQVEAQMQQRFQQETAATQAATAQANANFQAQNALLQQAAAQAAQNVREGRLSIADAVTQLENQFSSNQLGFYGGISGLGLIAAGPSLGGFSAGYGGYYGPDPTDPSGLNAYRRALREQLDLARRRDVQREFEEDQGKKSPQLTEHQAKALKNQADQQKVPPNRKALASKGRMKPNRATKKGAKASQAVAPSPKGPPKPALPPISGPPVDFPDF